MSKGLIPIVKTSCLYLVDRGHGDGRRFAGLFRETWKLLPMFARKAMVRHWRDEDSQLRLLAGVHVPDRKDPRGTPPRTYSPRVELAHGWEPSGWEDAIIPPGDGREHDMRNGMAAVFAQGHLLRFHAPTLDRMPEDVARDLIAHELIHVYQHAIGYEAAFGEADPPDGEVELMTDEMMECWGFRPHSIDSWAAGEGLIPVKECADLEEYLREAYGPGSRYDRAIGQP